MSIETDRLIESLHEQIKLSESQAQIAAMQASDNAAELKDYRKKYKELEAAAKVAALKSGVKVQANEYTVQAFILEALDRMAVAVRDDTVDTRMKKLEQICYQAESTSGVMCREANPWDRVAWVLNQMAAEINRLKHTSRTPDRIRERIFAIQRNLQAENHFVPNSEQEAVLNVLNAIEKKAIEAQNFRAACMKLKELL